MILELRLWLLDTLIFYLLPVASYYYYYSTSTQKLSMNFYIFFKSRGDLGREKYFFWDFVGSRLWRVQKCLVEYEEKKNLKDVF